MAESVQLQLRHYLCLQSEDSGDFTLLVGPNPLDDTGVKTNERYVIPDPKNPGEVIVLPPGAGAEDAIQPFVTLKHDEYAVISNPVHRNMTPENRDDVLEAMRTNPNGSAKSGRNDMEKLEYGNTQVITSGSFPLWPGQTVVVHKVHALQPDEYLLVRVDTPQIDPEAPYYALTMACAEIAEEPIASGTDEEDDAEDTGEKTSEAENEAPTVEEEVQPVLKRNQIIVIPGSKTRVYIPPTGTSLMPIEEEAGDSEESEDTAEFVSINSVEIVQEAVSSDDLTTKNLREKMSQAGIISEYQYIASNLPAGEDSTVKPDAFLRLITDSLQPDELESLARVFLVTEEKKVAPIRVDARGVVRQAPVLGHTEFCILIKEDGTAHPVPGPRRVFPKASERILIEGSDGTGVYEAYRLTKDRGILIRVIVDSISKTLLAEQLPDRCASFLEEDTYYKGDEIFFRGVEAYLIPGEAFIIIHPETGKQHIGNDHEGVFVKEIGVDQESGIYVETLSTGAIDTVEGEDTVILDPRKQRRVMRRIPAKLWNYTVGETEPHRQVAEGTEVETPWAWSIRVPSNTAMLVTSRSGSRVVMGGTTVRLKYDEAPELLDLSKGTPKTESSTIQTCFLNVQENKVSDEVTVTTANGVDVTFTVSYGVSFVGRTQEELGRVVRAPSDSIPGDFSEAEGGEETPGEEAVESDSSESEAQNVDLEAERLKWFVVRNYVWKLVTHARSRLRSAAEGMTLSEMSSNRFTDFVRDTILGAQGSGEGNHRRGLHFGMNRMYVFDVDVLEYEIPDDEVASAFEEAQRIAVTLEISDRTARSKLASAQEQSDIAEAESALTIAKAEREKEAKIAEAKAQHEADLEKAKLVQELNAMRAENEHALALVAQGNKDAIFGLQDALAKKESAAKIELRQNEASAALTILEDRGEKEIALAASQAAEEIKVLQANSAALVEQIKAISPTLAASIQSLADAQVLKALIEELPAATGYALLALLLHDNGLPGFVAGTPFAPILADINARFAGRFTPNGEVIDVEEKELNTESSEE